MKKLLLLGALGAMTFAANGAYLDKPASITDLPLQYVSPDGKYAGVSESGLIVIYNLETQKETQYFDANGVVTYSLGQLNYCMSARDIAVGYGAGNNRVLDMSTGKWADLPALASGSEIDVFGITPDASMICGAVSNTKREGSGDNTINLVPVIWNRNEKGNYSRPELLPYPATDWAGLPPQAILPLAISDNGNRIAGQVTDCIGYFYSPIVWERQDDGSWDYFQPVENLVNPNKVVMGEYPDLGNPKTVDDFMTPTEQSEYAAALEKWKEETPNDYSLYPEVTDFMTAEELEAWTNYMNEYNYRYEHELLPWFDRYSQVLEASTHFGHNAMCFNGNLYAVQITRNVPGSATSPDEEPETTSAILVINVNTGSTYEIPDVTLNSLANDGTVLARRADFDRQLVEAVTALPGKSEVIPFQDWMVSLKPEYGTFITDNLLHTTTILVDKEVNGEWTTVEETVEAYYTGGDPGGAYTTGSMNMVVMRVDQIWDLSDDSPVYMGYLFPVNANSGVDAIEAAPEAALELAARRGGFITVKGDAARVQVVDLQGREVFASAATGAEISTGLTEGIYLVKATDRAGRSKVAKVVF